MSTILSRAADRGEIPPENITPLVATVPWDLLRNKLMTSNGEVTDTYVEEIVDDVFLPLLTRNSVKNCSPGDGNTDVPAGRSGSAF